MVNLHEYFQKQQSGISEQSKMDIYHKILERQTSTSNGLFKKITLIAKFSSYSLVTAFLVFALFGLLNSTSYNNILNNKGFQVSHTQPNTYRASADTRVTIAKFQGHYKLIDKDGKYVETNIVFPNDTIQLEYGSIIKVNVDGNDLTMVGPAIVQIEESSEKGKYIMKFTQDPTFAKLSSQNNTSSTVEIIKQDNVKIQKADKASNINIQMSTSNGTTKISNHGDPINVSNDQKQTITIKSQQNIVLENTPNKKSDEEQLAPSQSQFDDIVQFLADNTTQADETTPIINETITIDQKQIPSEQQLSKITNLLQTSVLEYHINNLLISIVQEKPEQQTIALTNLHDILMQVGQVLNIDLIASSSFNNVMANTNTLITTIPARYLLPPRVTNHMIVIKNRMELLNQKSMHNDDQNIDKDSTKLMEKLQSQQRNLNFTRTY